MRLKPGEIVVIIRQHNGLWMSLKGRWQEIKVITGVLAQATEDHWSVEYEPAAEIDVFIKSEVARCVSQPTNPVEGWRDHPWRKRSRRKKDGRKGGGQ